MMDWLNQAILNSDVRLIAGPVLRRQTRTSLSVWIAVRSEEPVRLQVFDPAGGSDAPLVEPFELFQVGEHVFVGLATVQAPQGFASGVVYTYLLDGAGIPTAGSAFWQALSSGGPGVLAERPSFLGLPDDASDLRVATTSCRKPHGGGHDALAHLAQHLGDQRPHVLLLTGDQIYADDVAAPVMMLVKEVARLLVGGNEFPFFDQPGIADTINARTQASLLDGRKDASNAFLNYRGANHLWTFAEYLAMYLLVWSDQLWPTEWPVGSDDAVMDNMARTSFLDEYAPVGDGHHPVRVEVAEKWNEEVDLVRPYQQALPAVRRALANIPTLMVFDDHEITDDWNLSFWHVHTTYANPYGRRIVGNGLLAYVACQHWGNVPERFALVASPERLSLQNAWQGGTSPIDDAMLDRLGLPRGALDGNGDRIESAVHVVPGKPDAEGMATRTHERYEAPRESPPVGWQASGAVWMPELPDDDEAFDWSLSNGTSPHRIDYAYRLGAAQGWPVDLVVLDERMARHFTGADDVCERVAEPAFDAMWPAPDSDTPPDRTTLLVCAAPFLGLHLFEEIAQPVTAFTSDNAAADREGWGASTAGYRRLLLRAHQWRRVVAISGDVHFGYTRAVDTEHAASTRRLVQFCVSASKNASRLTSLIHQLGLFASQIGLMRKRPFVLFDTKSDARTVSESDVVEIPWDTALEMGAGRIDRMLDHEPQIFPAEVADQLGWTGASARFTIHPVEDLRPAATGNPLATAMAAVEDAPSGWDPEASMRTTRGLRALDLHLIGRMAQGLPMVGRISFSASPPTARMDLDMMIGSPGNGEWHPPRTTTTVTEVVLDPEGAP